MIGNGSEDNNSGQSFEDKLNNATGQTLEAMGSVAFLGMRAGDVAADRAKHLREAATVGFRLTEETTLALVYIGASKALVVAHKLFGKRESSDEEVVVDGIPVLPDQLRGLDMLATEDRTSARNTLAGSTVFSIDQQLRKGDGLTDGAEASRDRFVKLAQVEAGFSGREASHLASLPDPQHILDN